MRKVILAILIGFLIRHFYILYTTTWTGFYYPDFENNPNNVVVKEGLGNSDTCLMRANGMIKGNKVEDYECGSNCRFDSSLNNRRCEKTIQ